ncbi:MAG: polysaccharide biosynthesis protein [Pseudomonadota bacterium]
MRLSKIIAANYLGLAWASLMSVAFVPAYIKLLGPEAYGVIGVYILLHNASSLFDIGVRPMLTREMARAASGTLDTDQARDLLRSAELFCGGVCLALMAGVMMSSGPLAGRWLQLEALTASDISYAFILIAIVVALRFQEATYRSALVGLGEQIWVNGATAILATLRSGGAVLVLAMIETSLAAFFIWQAFVSAVSLGIYSWKTWHSIGRGQRRARWSLHALSKVKRFTGAMAIIMVLIVALSQVDKLILSGSIGLAQFGHYVFASTAASAIFMVSLPLSQAIYPHFVASVERRDPGQLRRLYHASAQLLAAVIAPVICAAVAFPYELLYLWSGQSGLAQAAAPILVFLVIGQGLFSIARIPYDAQLAHGWTRLALIAFGVSTALLIPGIILLTPHYGGVGAAAAMALSHGLLLAILAGFMYRKILRGEGGRWLVKDVIAPFSGPALLLVPATLMAPSAEASRTLWLVFFFAFTLASYATMIITCAALRLQLFAQLKRSRAAFQTAK